MLAFNAVCAAVAGGVECRECQLEFRTLQQLQQHSKETHHVQTQTLVGSSCRGDGSLQSAGTAAGRKWQIGCMRNVADSGEVGQKISISQELPPDVIKISSHSTFVVQSSAGTGEVAGRTAGKRSTSLTGAVVNGDASSKRAIARPQTAGSGATNSTGAVVSLTNCEVSCEVLRVDGVKWFQCSVCQYKSAHRRNANRHLRTHTG